MGHKFNFYRTENSMRGRPKKGKGGGGGGGGGGRKAPIPLPFSLSPTPFDACYAGYIENKITVATI